MKNKSTKAHWDTIYATKNPNEVSWTQEIPKISLEFITSLNIEKTANIIDVGGGDSNLVDFLLDAGYENISVLDISEKALSKSKERLGEKAKKITWIVSDIVDFQPSQNYDVWHDRASFHFLIEKEEISNYKILIEKFVSKHLIIGTFSRNGPLKCSGLEIKQYDEQTLSELFSSKFKKISCCKIDHLTPFKTLQNFLFCSFERL